MHTPPSAAGAKPAPAPHRGGLGRATALISAATLLSRVLGLVREQAFAALLGAGFHGDAFTMAFRLPNLLRDLFAEGALSAAFQPAFAERLRQGGRAEAYRLANRVLTVLLLVVGSLTLLGALLAPQLVGAWAAGYAAIAGKAELTVLLTRIMMPFLLLVSLAAVAMGMLNAEERFLPPALAPALFNLASIAGGALLWLSGQGAGRTAAIGWSLATLVGGALQLLVQLVPLRRAGFRLSLQLDLRDPHLRQMALTMVPAAVGLMATQVNIYVNSSLASTQDGAVTWLNVAFRLLQLPIGLFGVAVGTVALARYAHSAAEGDVGQALDGVRDTLRRALRMVSFLTLPTAVALWVLAEPIVTVLYEHGAFTHADTLAAAAALRLYSLGLLAYAAVKVVAPVFYALKLPRIPVAATGTAVAANVLLAVTLHRRYGYQVLALGTSVAAVANLAVLLRSFERRYGGALRPEVLLAMARIAGAALVMGGVVATLDGAVGHASRAWGGGWPAALVRLCVDVPVGAAVYGGLCWLMGLEEMRALVRRLGRR
ncbi:MAG: murein biosynthesis integral membrane protein MurJ [Myxococcales bacterium]|nr:murein biosynthesis integral membrane protein MurJ [Myxococcota bacterium]MDW8284078.1 murein biosynthesis integral membrane protein MurJ [Myxococcales bacterium]